MYQREGAFVFWVVGLFVLVVAVYSLRKGSVPLLIRFLDMDFSRRKAPVRFWLIISVYAAVATLLIGKGWQDWM